MNVKEIRQLYKWIEEHKSDYDFLMVLRDTYDKDLFCKPFKKEEFSKECYYTWFERPYTSIVGVYDLSSDFIKKIDTVKYFKLINM